MACLSIVTCLSIVIIDATGIFMRSIKANEPLWKPCITIIVMACAAYTAVFVMPITANMACLFVETPALTGIFISKIAMTGIGSRAIAVAFRAAMTVIMVVVTLMVEMRKMLHMCVMKIMHNGNLTNTCHP